MEYIIALLFFILLVLGFFIWRFYQKNRVLEQSLSDLKAHPQDWAIHSSQNLIVEAQKQANTIMTDAQTASINLAAQKRAEDQQLEQKYEHQIESLGKTSIDDLEKNLKEFTDQYKNAIAVSSQQYTNFLAQAEASLSKSQANTEEKLRSKVNELLFNFEQNLSGFLASSQQKSLESVGLEVKSARQLIDSYKSAQLSIIDENIVSVLEETLALVLKEKLSLRNQTDLIFEALQKAKTEKFFV